MKTRVRQTTQRNISCAQVDAETHVTHVTRDKSQCTKMSLVSGNLIPQKMRIQMKLGSFTSHTLSSQASTSTLQAYRPKFTKYYTHLRTSKSAPPRIVWPPLPVLATPTSSCSYSTTVRSRMPGTQELIQDWEKYPQLGSKADTRNYMIQTIPQDQHLFLL